MRNLSIPPQPYHELIETLWNLNSVLLRVDCMIILELIETLWNVNYLLTISKAFASFELIETLWNVNQPYRMDKFKN